MAKSSRILSHLIILPTSCIPPDHPELKGNKGARQQQHAICFCVRCVFNAHRRGGEKGGGGTASGSIEKGGGIRKVRAVSRRHPAEIELPGLVALLSYTQCSTAYRKARQKKNFCFWSAWLRVSRRKLRAKLTSFIFMQFLNRRET